MKQLTLTKRLALSSIALSLSMAVTPAHAQSNDLTIESWRSEDQAVWNDIILPAFHEAHPEINVAFKPTSPTEYNAALNARLDGGTAGDIITCRPFDGSLALYESGHLADISDLDGLNNFSDVAKSAWSTDDGEVTFCVPMGSVIHGFFYNKEAFNELGIEPPITEAEFFSVLETIKEDGSYTPLAMGTSDQWESATMGYTNIGPAYWHGEEGRQALINGEAKFTDDKFVKPFEVLAKWSDYLGNGYQAQSYTDSQNLFTLGRAAIYPTGSWEITGFEENAFFEMGVFPPPIPTEGDQCYISDHTDIGIGMNPATNNPEAARTFLEWVSTEEFASLFSNALPGFFSLSDSNITIENELASEFYSWRDDCESTIRVAHQIISRGEPNTWNTMWVESANVINGSVEPSDAAQTLQSGLENWYEPHQ